jgi:hypothetical protein
MSYVLSFLVCSRNAWSLYIEVSYYGVIFVAVYKKGTAFCCSVCVIYRKKLHVAKGRKINTNEDI